MAHKLFTFLVGTILTITSITGCVTFNSTSNNRTNKQIQIETASDGLTESSVSTDIENSEKDHSINDIQMISLENIDGQSFAFASFNEDGKRKYANIYESAKQGGRGTCIFTASKVKGSPLQAVQQFASDGYTWVTGVVVDSPGVENVIITFSNGDIRQVPVRDGCFWFFGKVGATQSDAYLKHMIGVSNHGEILSNRP